MPAKVTDIDKLGNRSEASTYSVVVNREAIKVLEGFVLVKPIMYFDVVKLYADAYKSLAECSKVAVLGLDSTKTTIF